MISTQYLSPSVQRLLAEGFGLGVLSQFRVKGCQVVQSQKNAEVLVTASSTESFQCLQIEGFCFRVRSLTCIQISQGTDGRKRLIMFFAEDLPLSVQCLQQERLGLGELPS